MYMYLLVLLDLASQVPVRKPSYLLASWYRFGRLTQRCHRGGEARRLLGAPTALRSSTCVSSTRSNPGRTSPPTCVPHCTPTTEPHRLILGTSCRFPVRDGETLLLLQPGGIRGRQVFSRPARRKRSQPCRNVRHTLVLHMFWPVISASPL